MNFARISVSLIKSFLTNPWKSLATLAIGYTTYRVIKSLSITHFLADITSRVLAIGACKSSVKPEVLRGQFNDVTLPKISVAKNHTHGEAAADRSGASALIDHLADLTGFNAYYVQKSRSDERKGREGSRSYFWSKDLTVEPESFLLPSNPIMAFVDVDQYIDMNDILVDQFVPTILYTFQPGQVTRSTPDYSYTFDANNEVDYRVTGGGHYHHKVWNYGTDHLFLQRKLFGITYQAAVYLVDRRGTSPDHELVLLSPVMKWNLPFCWVARWLYGKGLDRVQPVVGEFLRLETHGKSGVQRSTGRVGGYGHALVSAADDDTIACIARTSKLDLTMPQCLSFVDGDRVAAASLLEYHRSKVDHKPDVVCPVPESVRRYQFEPRNYDPEAKPMLLPFMNPFMDDCFAPDLTPANERQCVQGRVENVKCPTMVLTPFLALVMREFAALFVPVAHQMDPMDDDYVHEKQNRPSQRRILEETACMLPKRNIQMHMKKEPYGDIKDPRPISQINGVDKREYSKFIYTLAEHIKTQPWYAFGKTPIETSKRVAQTVANARFAVNSDFSKFDGHVSNLLREMEKMVFMRAFRPIYHEQLLELHRSQYNLSAFGALGIKYETTTARASGSPETAVCNSLVNAFVAYLAFRMKREDGGYFEPQEAWSRLGIYGGDDGLTADMDAKTYVKAAVSIGQKLDVEAIQRGQIGIKFLARMYGPNVWFGDINSCCDLQRQLSKFHTTVSLPPKVTPAMKLLEKCRAYYLTDENTPVLGEFVCQVLTVYGGVPEFNPEFENCTIWGSWIPKDDQYPNEPSEWMKDYARTSLPDFEFDRFYDWLRQANTLEGLMGPPLCIERRIPKTDVPVVIDGDVKGAGTEKNGAAWNKRPSQSGGKTKTLPDKSGGKTKTLPDRPERKTKTLSGKPWDKQGEGAKSDQTKKETNQRRGGPSKRGGK